MEQFLTMVTRVERNWLGSAPNVRESHEPKELKPQSLDEMRFRVATLLYASSGWHMPIPESEDELCNLLSREPDPLEFEEVLQVLAGCHDEELKQELN